MSLKFFALRNLPVLLSTLALLLTIPLFIWGLSQKQETRKSAAEPVSIPQVDLNNDGVVNNIDLQIYRSKFATPQP